MNTIKRSGRRGRPFSRLLRKLKTFFRKAKTSVSGFFSKLGAKIKRIDIPAFFRKLSKKTFIIGSCGVTGSSIDNRSMYHVRQRARQGGRNCRLS